MKHASMHASLYRLNSLACSRFEGMHTPFWNPASMQKITVNLSIKHCINYLQQWIQQFQFAIIQILTGTVMKYHVSMDCQESYVFPKDYIFPKCAALRENIVPRENITILAPPTRDISSVPVDICYIRWSKWMISSKFYVLYDYHEVW